MAEGGDQAPKPVSYFDEPVVYPGRMLTYPGHTRGRPPLFVHDCVMGCPQMAPRPRQPLGEGESSGLPGSSTAGRPGAPGGLPGNC